MKPIELIIEAFGPYAKKQVIDFRELASEHIFLITGKTGAGKSTLFDAMSFALYGEANGDMRDSQSLRSDYADADTPTEVSLTFDTNGVRYRIVRRPQQLLNKKRGSGQRLISGEASLFKLESDTETVLGANIRDVQEAMAGIIPLTVTQFRQIMMIPQNEFRELLMSNSKDKEEILQKLADTAIYKKIQEQLFEKQRESEEVVKVIDRQLQGLRDDYHELAAADENLQQHSDIMAHLATLNQATLASLESTEMQKNSVEQRHTKLQQELAIAQTLIRQWEQREQVTTSLATLEEQAEEQSRQSHLLEQATAAQPIMAWISEQEKIKAAILEKEQLVKTAAEELTLLNSTTDQLTTTKAELEAKREQYLTTKAETAEWQRYLPAWQQLQSLQEQMNTIVKAQEANKEKFDRQVVLLETDNQLVVEAEKHVERAQGQETQRLLITQRMEEQQRWLQLYSEVDELLDASSRDTEAVGYLEQQLAKEVAKSERLQQERSNIIAEERQQLVAQIASQLQEGDTCPVCGSESHPHIAEAAHLIDSEKALADIEQLMKGVLSQIEETKIQIRTKQFQIKQTAGHIAASYEKLNVTATTASEQYEWHVQALKDEQAELSALNYVLTYEEAKAKQQRLIANYNRHLEEKQALEVALKTAVAQIRGIASDRQRLEADTPPRPDDLKAVIKAVEEATQIISAFEAEEQSVSERVQANQIQLTKQTAALDSAEKALHTEQERLTEMTNSILEKQRAAGFNDQASFEAACLASEVFLELKEQVTAYQQKYAQLKEQLATLVGVLDGQTYPDIASIQNNLNHCNEERDVIEQRVRVYQQQAGQEEQLINGYRKQQAAIVSAESVYSQVSYLANVARGKNGSKLTFERYVLTAFLDLILEYANPRLRTMTDGRYQLQRQAELTKGNAQSGLELSVIDAYTSKTRHVKTLSGGESFKASLALALALADCIQELSGGMSLETIFIDEGFGTLDPDSLEQAIDMLLDTQANGRLVGIISHVPELKSRIHSKLVINQTAKGSTTHFSFN